MKIMYTNRVIVERSEGKTWVGIHFFLLDREQNTAQGFSKVLRLYPGRGPAESENKEIIYLLRRSFEAMMKDLEYAVTEQKREGYRVEIGPKTESMEIVNCAKNERGE